MRKIFNIIFILSSIFSSIYAQDQCLGVLYPEDNSPKSSCVGNSSAYQDIYRYQSFYTPNNNTSVKTLRVNFIVMQDNNSGDRKNFTSNQFFYDLIAEVNNLYRTVKPPTDPITNVCGSCFISDSKIQFEIENIVYKIDGANYANTSDYNYNNYGINKTSELNIIVIGIESNIVGSWVNRFPSLNLNAEQYVMTTDYYYSYLNDPGYLTATSRNLAHELGHILNLRHTYEPSCCHETCTDSDIDYLVDVFGLNPSSVCWYDLHCQAADPNIPNCTNNLMGASYGQFCYMSPLQMGRMHRSLSLYSCRKYVKDTYSSIPLSINNYQEWDFNIQLYQDIAINTNGNLSLNCEVLMPIAGKLIVNNGGKLLLNGNLSTNTSQRWQGIIVNNGGIIEISNSTISNYDITVKNGGTLKIPSNATVNIINTARIEIESGGFICLESGATINLQDYLSVINLRNGYQIGVNPSVPGLIGNCTANPATFAKTGNGSINTFMTNNYVQNQTFIINNYLSGFNIFAGTSVTTTKPQGPVIIQSGANVVFDADGDNILDKGFEVQSGASFEAK